MKAIILLFSGLICVLSSLAQRSAKTFAITSNSRGTYTWTEIREIDISSGRLLRNIYESKDQAYQVFNARSKAKINVNGESGVAVDQFQLPFGGLSAAMAYDRKNERLYFCPIFKNELRYIDLKESTPKFYYYSNEPITNVEQPAAEQNHITRMVINTNGKGYALTNDAMHLIEFNTTKQQAIRDLGALEDDEKNAGITIHDKTAGWGGDMVADEEGLLYLFSANRHVFKIDPLQLKASFVGIISGIPDGYSTNGAAVDDEGKVILASAVNTQTYYRVNMETLEATPVLQQDGVMVYNCSDLANENFLKVKRAPLPAVMQAREERNALIQVFPNPVTGNRLKLLFNEPLKGRFEVQMLDGKGHHTFQSMVNITGTSQVIELSIPPVSKGAYIIKVNSNGIKKGSGVVIVQ